MSRKIDPSCKKKNGKAVAVIVTNVIFLLLAIPCLIIGLVTITLIPVGIIFLCIGGALLFKYIKNNKAKKDIQVYVAPLVNHPEFSLTQIADMVGKPVEKVEKDIENMLKSKILFGTLNKEGNKFTLDEDFDLRFLAEQNGWAGALIINIEE